MRHILNFFIIFLLFFSLNAFAQQTLVRENGYITEKKSSGEILVNGRWFEIDMSCEILDNRGYSLSPSSLTVQSRIMFEYEKDQGRALPAIKRIKVLPQ